eukprot:366470-Chlamydomonas_euryale.AAC.9
MCRAALQPRWAAAAPPALLVCVPASPASAWLAAPAAYAGLPAPSAPAAAMQPPPPRAAAARHATGCPAAEPCPPLQP